MAPPSPSASLLATILNFGSVQTDSRQSIVTTTTVFDQNNYGFVPPSLTFWIQILIILSFQTLVAVVVGYVVYNIIIAPHQKNKRTSTMTTTSITAHLIVWGGIIPFFLLFPYGVIEWWDVRNKVHKFCFMLIPTLCSFRCLEALYGFSPTSSEQSLPNYLLYFASVLEVTFNPHTHRPQPLARGDITRYCVSFLIHFLEMGVLISVLAPVHYEPFETKVEVQSLDHSWRDCLRVGHIGNNLFAAVLLQHYLTVFSDALRILTALVLNIHTGEMMKNPLFTTTSPSDFWGRKWNLLIHGVLKRGVYLPARRRAGLSRGMSTALVFFASGAFHEWILSLVFMPLKGECGGEDGVSPELLRVCHYPHVYYKNLLFFMWNAGVVGLDQLIGGWTIFKTLSQRLPSLVVTVLVVMTALPVAHWFTGDFISSDFFFDGAIGFPVIVRL